ncbi:MAG: response regulator [Candidatus Aminicenantes bacterium]|jgi:PAS domain S-box-containing protein
MDKRDIFLRFAGKDKNRFAFLFFSLFFAFHCYSQSYQVHHYSVADGLPNAHVYDITQDHWGRMWFATHGGISCYDGVSWKNFTQGDGIPAFSFSKISVDRRGRIWALLDPGRNGNLSIYIHDGTPGNGWQQILDLKFNFTKRDGVTSFQLVEQEREGQPLVVVGTAQSGLFLGQRGQWKRLTVKDGLLSNTVKGITQWQGKCYLATDKGIAVLNNDGTIDNRLNRLLNLPSKEINGICVEYKDKYPGSRLKDSRLWLCGHQWLGYFYLSESNYKMVFFRTGKSFGKERETNHLLPDYRGGLYIGNRYDIYYFNYQARTWESLHVINGLISEAAYSMYIDFEKNIWISCGRGLSKISSRRFSNFHRIHGLLEEEVTAVLEIEPGKFVLGHNRGLTFWDGKQFRKMPFRGKDEAELPFCRVLDIKADSKQNIWLTAERVGLGRVNKQKEIKWYGKTHGLPDHIMSTSVWIDHSDGVWVGTSQGIFVMAASENRFVPIGVEKFPTPEVRKIYAVENILYLGSTFYGVYAYEMNTNHWKNYRKSGEKDANNVFAIKRYQRGRLLIGTIAGLYTLDPVRETLKRFKADNFEIHDPVYFIVRDHRHRLWFGTNNGVVRWDGSKARRYSLAEGLVGHETNRAAGILDSKGRIWIGTNRGVSIYNEQFDDYINRTPPPKLRLLDVEVNKRKIPLDPLSPPVQLNYKNNPMVFHFRGISFVDETAIRFKHKLEGFDQDWLDEHYPFKQMIRYSNLPPGQYRFHLKARNALGVWSEPVISPQLVILGPFYHQWWFLLLVFLGMLIVFYGIFRYFLEKRHGVLLEKQVEERTNQLRTLEKEYRSLFEESKDVVFVTGPGGKLIDINPAGVQLLGYQSKEEIFAIGSVLNLYYTPKDRRAFREKIESQGYVKDYEITFKRKDGQPIVGQTAATLVRDKQGNITGYRGIIRDMTRQKELEQRLIQAQKMEAIGTLAGGIAHDFNNILAVIVGHAELMREELPEESRMRKSAEQIVTSSERGAELVKQILAFSRQSKRNRKPLQLKPVIKESLRLLRSVLPSTIEIRQDIQPTCARILADPTQIHQIMMNLGTNAAHAMRDQGGILEVKLEGVVLDAESVKTYHDINPGPYLKLTVSDTGHGMPPEVIERIFEPYFTTKKTGEGTGMGLAVIHGIVKSYDGDITVRSEPGKKTSFDVVFPCFRERRKQERKPRLIQEIPRGSERILLVDDEIALADVGTQMLERLGYQVKGTSDAIEALEIFSQEPQQFDLVISDMTMPHMTGFQLAEKIKQIDPDTPIILCSGFTSTATRKQIKNSGVSDFVTKPINRIELARVVRKVLDSK